MGSSVPHKKTLKGGAHDRGREGEREREEERQRGERGRGQREGDSDLCAPVIPLSARAALKQNKALLEALRNAVKARMHWCLEVATSQDRNHTATL